MSAPQTAPLKVVNPTELNQGWDTIMRELPILAEWISRTFAVDVTFFDRENNIIFSESQPEGSESDAIWVNTINPVFIGIPKSDGSYQKIYQYPLNTPFLWLQGEDKLPSYLRKLSGSEMESMGLTLPDETTYLYAILES